MRLVLVLASLALLAACQTTVTVRPTVIPSSPSAIAPSALPETTSTPSPRLSRLNVRDPSEAEIQNFQQAGSNLRVGSLMAFEQLRDEIVVALAASNTGNRPVSFYKSVQLQDSGGRRYDMLESPRDLLNYFKGSDWTQDWDIVPYTESLQPGRRALIPVLFRVSEASQDLRLVPALP